MLIPKILSNEKIYKKKKGKKEKRNKKEKGKRKKEQKNKTYQRKKKENKKKDTGSRQVRAVTRGGPTTGISSTLFVMLLKTAITLFFSVRISLNVPFAGTRTLVNKVKKKKDNFIKSIIYKIIQK